MPGRPPAVLWYIADEEFPTDREKRRERYLELMREEGHIVKATPGQTRSLPCGWPENRVEQSDESRPG